jgi:hypothetical protein
MEEATSPPILRKDVDNFCYIGTQVFLALMICTVCCDHYPPY